MSSFSLLDAEQRLFKAKQELAIIDGTLPHMNFKSLPQSSTSLWQHQVLPEMERMAQEFQIERLEKRALKKSIFNPPDDKKKKSVLGVQVERFFNRIAVTRAPSLVLTPVQEYTLNRLNGHHGNLSVVCQTQEHDQLKTIVAYLLHHSTQRVFIYSTDPGQLLYLYVLLQLYCPKVKLYFEPSLGTCRLQDQEFMICSSQLPVHNNTVVFDLCVCLHDVLEEDLFQSCTRMIWVQNSTWENTLAFLHSHRVHNGTNGKRQKLEEKEELSMVSPPPEFLPPTREFSNLLVLETVYYLSPQVLFSRAKELLNEKGKVLVLSNDLLLLKQLPGFLLPQTNLADIIKQWICQSQQTVLSTNFATLRACLQLNKYNFIDVDRIFLLDGQVSPSELTLLQTLPVSPKRLSVVKFVLGVDDKPHASAKLLTSTKSEETEDANEWKWTFREDIPLALRIYGCHKQQSVASPGASPLLVKSSTPPPPLHPRSPARFLVSFFDHPLPPLPPPVQAPPPLLAIAKREDAILQQTGQILRSTKYAAECMEPAKMRSLKIVKERLVNSSKVLHSALKYYRPIPPPIGGNRSRDGDESLLWMTSVEEESIPKIGPLHFLAENKKPL